MICADVTRHLNRGLEKKMCIHSGTPMPTTPPTSYFKEDFTNMEGLSVFFSCLHAVGDPVFGGDVTGGDLTPAGFSAC